MAALVAALAGFYVLGAPAADWWLGLDELGLPRLGVGWLRELVAFLMPMGVAAGCGILTWNALSEERLNPPASAPENLDDIEDV